jgi:protein transport protein SEC24
VILTPLHQLAFRDSAQIPPDLRAYAHALLTTLPTQSLIPYVHPRFYSLHNMPANVSLLRKLWPDWVV